MISGKWREGGSELQTKCPRCGHEKLFVSMSKRVGHCFWPHSAAEGSQDFGPRDLRELVHPSDQQVVSLRQWPRLVPAWEHDDARCYLKHRGIEWEDPDIQYDPAMQRIYVRITSPSPDLPPSYHTRGIQEGTGWVVFPGTQKAHYWLDCRFTMTRVVIVEGIFDALKVHAAGYAVVALLGTQMSNTHFAVLRNYQKVFLWLDPDKAGEEATVKIWDRFVEKAGVIPSSAESDKEPGDCTLEEIRAVIGRAWR